MQNQTSQTTAKKARPPYHLIFIFLAVFTALEVGASYLPEGIKIPILVVLAVVKAMLVILFFMHLKYDRKVYLLPFIIALVLGLPLVLIVSIFMPMLQR